MYRVEEGEDAGSGDNNKSEGGVKVEDLKDNEYRENKSGHR